MKPNIFIFMTQQFSLVLCTWNVFALLKTKLMQCTTSAAILRAISVIGAICVLLLVAHAYLCRTL